VHKTEVGWPHLLHLPLAMTMTMMLLTLMRHRDHAMAPPFRSPDSTSYRRRTEKRLLTAVCLPNMWNFWSQFALIVYLCQMFSLAPTSLGHHHGRSPCN